jgi:tetratricopeptide (TPR) repeat protein
MRSGAILASILSGALFAGIVAAQPPSAETNTYQRYLRTGADLLMQRDYSGAREAFEEALRYNDGDAEAYLGLGVACFHLQRDNDAERALRQALRVNPKEKGAYQLLGELAYRQDDLEGAVAAWERAVELDPSDKVLKARVARLRREERTERSFNRDATGHFSVKYEGRERVEAGRIVLRILEDAYSDIGRQLSYYPGNEIAVILYSGQQFNEVTDAPTWSGGLYDGRIRIPVGGIEEETPGLRRLLYHEYAHAVVRAITPRAPAWLNEGLAQYCEGREIDGAAHEELRALGKAGKIPSLRSLEGPFNSLGSGQAREAYLLSLSAVRYMGDRFGLYRVRMVLDELAQGADPTQAMNNALLVSFEDFERGWKQSLE